MTDEEILRSNVELRLRWLRNKALALRDLETRDREIRHISDFPLALALSLDDAADTIEKLLAERAQL